MNDTTDELKANLRSLQNPLGPRAADVIERLEAAVVVTDAMIDRALNAWFASPPSETDQGLARSMRAALEAALAKQEQNMKKERTETTSEHIARDIREGRFPVKSDSEVTVVYEKC